MMGKHWRTYHLVQEMQRDQNVFRVAIVAIADGIQMIVGVYSIVRDCANPEPSECGG